MTARTDSEIVAAAVTAWQAGSEITDGQARVIASQWHSGQVSALYSLASCGAIAAGSDDDPLVWEIVREIADVGALAAESEGLVALLGYVRARPARGPVAGWSQHWG